MIADAAVTLFATHGSGAVSVAAICRAAGVSRDTFYRSFPDKEALVGELYRSAVDAHMRSVTEASDLDYADPRWLHRVIDQTIDAILEQAAVARFLYKESADPASPAYAVVNAAWDRVARRMRRWYRARHGETPPLQYFKSLLAATQWLVQDAILHGKGPAEVARAKSAAEQLYLQAFAAPVH